MHEQKFQKALGGLINNEIGLLLIDNQFIKGVLLDVKQDHIVVDVNQNVYYFALQHIQALSKNAKDFHVSSKNVPYLDRNHLVDVLEAFRYSWVSINGLSNQALFGVLIRIAEDHITIINNTEQLYIQKSSISNFSRKISEDKIIKIKNQEQLDIQNSYTSNPEVVSHMDDQSKEQSADLTEKEIQDFQDEEQVTLEYPQISNEIDPIVNSKDPIVEKHAEEVIENVTNEYTDISQNKTIQDSVFDMNDESKEQSDSSMEVEMQECQVEEQVAFKHIQPTNEIGPIKSIEDPIVGKQAEDISKIENATNEHPEVQQQTDFIGATNSTRLVQHNLFNRVNEYSFDLKHQDVLESNDSVSIEEQFPLPEFKARRKKRRLHLTAWSTMNNEQHAIASQNDIGGKSELTDHEGNYIEMEQSSDCINSLLHPLHDQYTNEEFVTMEKKLESAETNSSHLLVRHVNPKEILEKQYYALMKHAETNSFHIPERQLNLSEEEQYSALMKHAAKMYRGFND